MHFRRRFAHCVTGLVIAFASAFLVLLASAPAAAASLTINKNAITRLAPLRTDPITRNFINRSECLSDDVFTFPLIISDYYGSDLEVWVTEGTADCTTREARTTTNATCWRVFKVTPSTNVPNVEIRVQDIAAKKKPPADLSVGTAEDCEGTTTAAQQLTLYFMLIRSLDNQAGDQWSTSLDLLGPAAPTGVRIGAGSSLLKAEWNTNNDTDVAGYRFFCDPPPGTSMTEVDSAFGPGPRTDGGGSNAGTVCPDASVVEEDAGEDAGDEDVSISDASADVCVPGNGGTGGSTGGGGGGACAASPVVKGFVPDPDFVSKYSCGDASGRTSTSTFLKGLTNWQPTSIAISAVDAVGNAGPLSEVSCGIPQPVNGFDEVYRSAGGTAGDGFCSIGALGTRKRASFMSALLLALPLVLARRSPLRRRISARVSR